MYCVQIFTELLDSSSAALGSIGWDGGKTGGWQKECLNLQPAPQCRERCLLIVFARHDLWLFIFNGVGRSGYVF